jgi:ArsR family transcriptional regulator
MFSLELDSMIEPDLVPLVAARFKALGEPRRLAILSALQEGEKSVGELAEATGRPQPNVSQHLASLAKAGLVASRRDGARVLYRNADPYVERICQAVCASLRERAREEHKRLGALVAGAGRRGGSRG